MEFVYQIKVVDNNILVWITNSSRQLKAKSVETLPYITHVLKEEEEAVEEVEEEEG